MIDTWCHLVANWKTYKRYSILREKRSKSLKNIIKNLPLSLPIDDSETSDNLNESLIRIIIVNKSNDTCF